MRPVVATFFVAPIILLGLVQIAEIKVVHELVYERSVEDFPAFKYLWDEDVPGPKGEQISVSGGHWEYEELREDVPYHFSYAVCNDTKLHPAECTNTDTECPKDLMNWKYITADNNPYPTFSANGFRNIMRNTRIAFVGDSTSRQQVLALVWSLGHKHIKWEKVKHPSLPKSCSADQQCMTDSIGNITICRMFMGSMATKIYHDGNYTLDHSRRGHGDTSCLLSDEFTNVLAEFDLVFVQGGLWYGRLPDILNSTTSPFEWVAGMIPTLFIDAMGELLSNLAERTRTVLVLGQVGSNCRNKTKPEEFDFEKVPGFYGWGLVFKMWNGLLEYIEERDIGVQIVDARGPLMQSVHAHPGKDCLHFCMNSAALNIYLDMYWNEVFSNDASSDVWPLL